MVVGEEEEISVEERADSSSASRRRREAISEVMAAGEVGRASLGEGAVNGVGDVDILVGSLAVEEL